MRICEILDFVLGYVPLKAYCTKFCTDGHISGAGTYLPVAGLIF